MAPPDDTGSGDDVSATIGVEAAMAALQAENAVLRSENAALIGRLAELERRLGLNSSNSGKPPSSDGLKKPLRVSSLREPSGKKSGGQKGHPGETLRRVEKPDTPIDHYPEICAACGELLTAAMATDRVARQVFDLPEPRPLIVTEHRAHGCRCAACGTRTRAAFPEGVTAPVQYGKRIGAFVLYLLHYQLLVGACNHRRSCSQTALIPARIRCQWGRRRAHITCHCACHHRAVLANGGSCSHWLPMTGLRSG